MRLPGFVDVHSHAFQRALRGTDRGVTSGLARPSFEDGRERRRPQGVRDACTSGCTPTCSRPGYTAVGEFHYLGLAEARAAAEAAVAAGVELVLLLRRVRTRRHRALPPGIRLPLLQRARGAPRRRASASASRRTRCARSRGSGSAIARTPATTGFPVHIHAGEQPREVAESLESSACGRSSTSPTWACLGRETTVVHATHVAGASSTCSRDGVHRVRLPDHRGESRRRLPARRGPGARRAVSFGSDSNVRLDPFEEARETEGCARRQSGRRNVFTVDALLSIGSDEGAGSLGLERWDDVEADLSHRSLRGADDPLAALVHGCSAEVLG